jgi:CRISPR-associated endonuclease/helicase Cas3
MDECSSSKETNKNVEVIEDSIFCAHINPKTLKKQSVKEHLYNVSILSKEFGSKISLEKTAELIGLLHDMGKGTKLFNSYIKYSTLNPKDKSLKGTINHSTAGAKYIYDNFFNINSTANEQHSNQYQKLTAQLISLAICSHHGGLIDCIDLKGIEKYTERMDPENEIMYDEALTYFISECMNQSELKNLFYNANKEIIILLNKIMQTDKSTKSIKFATGMLEKYLFSCVIDADRYDTYTFMEDAKIQPKRDSQDLWKELSQALESKINNYPVETEIDLLRQEVSLACKNFGINSPGIYQLSVPTGGGKTLSSLRYALEHAKEYKKERILYIIPFTTIIDQSAKEIRDVLGHEDMILEHHSNLINDNNEDETEYEYKLLTERWDSPIVLTTMIQFLNTIFSGGTQGVRRMHNLANSVIIFDEIQAIPIKCINIFNSALNFLSNICNATIILCTATQPLLSTTERPLKLSENPDMILNIQEKFDEMNRVRLIDITIIGGYSLTLIKEFIIDKINKVENVLVILNTKKAAKEIFSELNKANLDLPTDKQFVIFHLSTNMCPSHRMKILQEVRENLGSKRVICISTQLIEAGINISFECVVRSLAGLDSIAQAAGRCNRHGENPCKDVYIVNIDSDTENTSKIIDIHVAKECTKRVLYEFSENPKAFDENLLSQKAMELYYKYYFYERKFEMDYIFNNDKTMYDSLSTNAYGTNAYNSRNSFESKLMLKQAFKTAGNEFSVIDQNTYGVIVPYGEGKTLITLINGECSLSDLNGYLKRSQKFSVNLFETDKRKLETMEGIIGLKGGAILAISDEFYDEYMGVVFEKRNLNFCSF